MLRPINSRNAIMRKGRLAVVFLGSVFLKTLKIAFSGIILPSLIELTAGCLSSEYIYIPSIYSYIPFIAETTEPRHKSLLRQGNPLTVCVRVK